MIFYFSGTGNSAYVAKQLAKLLTDERLVAIGEAVSRGEYDFELGEGECIGWVFPVYSWGPAPIVADFASKLTLKNYTPSTSYCYMVATCGDDVGETMKIMRKALGGIVCQAAFSVQMPNNYILLPGFDVDSKEVESTKRDTAPQRIKYVASEIRAKHEVEDVVQGAFAWLKSRVIYPLFRKFYMSDRWFKVDGDRCSSCGLCVRMCPTANVRMAENGMPKWQGGCAMCLSCIHRCPHRAIEYGRVTQSKGRYHF